MFELLHALSSGDDDVIVYHELTSYSQSYM